MDIFVAIFTFYLGFDLVVLKNNYLANFKVEGGYGTDTGGCCVLTVA